MDGSSTSIFCVLDYSTYELQGNCKLEEQESSQESLNRSYSEYSVSMNLLMQKESSSELIIDSL